MDLLFNNINDGQNELKKTLGFLDGDFSYVNLEPDIKINTAYLIDFIGQSVYDKLVEDYKDSSKDPLSVSAIDFSRLYLASMAYLDYAPNNDLTHGNSGRSFRNEDNEKLPWEWQIDKDNAAISERAYKALDQLFAILDKSEWTEWTESEAYKTANKLFIKSAIQFDKAFSINKSSQLYYRLVPFMEDIETDEILPILSESVVMELKSTEEPSDSQKRLLNQARNALAYLSLAKGLKSFPVEMFPRTLVYAENTRMKSQARAEVMLFMENEGRKHLQKLENEYGKQTETFTELKTTNGLEEGKKYVNL